MKLLTECTLKIGKLNDDHGRVLIAQYVLIRPECHLDGFRRIRGNLVLYWGGHPFRCSLGLQKDFDTPHLLEQRRCLCLGDRSGLV